MATTLTPVLTTLPTTRPANGFGVFFWDSRYTFTPAGVADSLGYSNYVGPAGTNKLIYNAAYNGIRGAWLGIGFDSKGDAATVSNYKTGALSAWDNTSLSATEGLGVAEVNSVCVKSSDTFKWSVINRTQNLSSFSSPVTLHQVVSSTADLSYKRCRVRLQNQGKLLTVDIKDADGTYQTYLQQELVPTSDTANTVYNSVNPIPNTLKIGLSFSTGDTASNCWVKNFSVYGDTINDENENSIVDSLTGLTIQSATVAG